MWLSLLGIGVVIALGYWLARSRAASGPHITFAPSSTPSGESATRSVTGPAPRRNVLVGIDGDVNGKTFHIGMRTVTMGRSSSNFVQTLDEKASRTHCQFKPSLEGLFVRDMNSRNGMRVNGTPITAEELLEDGDRPQTGGGLKQWNHLGVENIRQRVWPPPASRVLPLRRQDRVGL